MSCLMFFCLAEWHFSSFMEIFHLLWRFYGGSKSVITQLWKLISKNHQLFILIIIIIFIKGFHGTLSWYSYYKWICWAILSGLLQFNNNNDLFLLQLVCGLPTLIFSDAKGNIRSNVDITLKYLKLGTKRLTSISDLFAAINILQNLQKIYESISMALNNNFQFKLLSWC